MMYPKSASWRCLVSVGWAVTTGALLSAEGAFEVLASFQQPGNQPLGRLIQLPSGETYGTAASGGAAGYGSVFRVTAGGQVETICSFTHTSGSTPGSGPTCGLAQGSDGLLYGTTAAGGANGFGVIFKVNGAGVYTKLVDFTGATGVAKGSVPGPLIAHTDGFLYGTTEAGGASGAGTIFKVSTSGAFTTLAQFTGLTTGLSRGTEPVGVLCASGNTFYGVTRRGGLGNLGTIYKITTAGAFTDLVDFTGTTGIKPGANPAGGLLLHSDGKLYGTTEFGGTNGFGTLFSLTTLTSPVFTSLRSFADVTGSQPVGELVASSGTVFFGCCAAGGTSGFGGVYQMTTANVHSLLMSFSGESGAQNGAVPRTGLVAGSDGQFHGTTSAGGPANLGTVFKISSAGIFTSIANLSPNEGWMPAGPPVTNSSGTWVFPMAAGGNIGGGTVLAWNASSGLSVATALGGTLGDAPDGALVEQNGSFYGVSTTGAGSGQGAAFRYTPGTGTSLLSTFTTTVGSLAEGSLVNGADGALYGVAREGGTYAKGTLYKVTTAGVRTRLVSLTGTTGLAAGAIPRGPLAFAPNQSLYGVTESGGTANTGVIFKLSPTGIYSVITEFSSVGPRSPLGGLVLGTDGFLYGTTRFGGAADAGTVIRVNPAAGTWSVVAEFDGLSAGTPAGELHAANNGSILGMATSGGLINAGAVFRYLPATGLHILANFTGLNGSTPGIAQADNGAGLLFTGGLTTASDGTIYGTASGGGNFNGGVFFRIVDTSPLALWKTTWLGVPNAPDTADPDFDGLSNILEYAIGTHPMVANSSPAASLTSFGDGTSLSLLVPRDPTRSDISLYVEASSTMEPPWTTLAASILGNPFSGIGYVSGETPGSTVKSILIRDTSTTFSANRRFIRLRVNH